jgi:hypothetical protein
MSDGNSKAGAVTIENPDTAGGGGARQRSSLQYTLWVNGVVAWKYVLMSPGPEFSGHRGCWGQVLDGLWG